MPFPQLKVNLQGLHVIFILLFEGNYLSLQQNYMLMKYSIALKNLPFVPEERQVIYIENEFDERANAIIKKNYEKLRWDFKRANMSWAILSHVSLSIP